MIPDNDRFPVQIEPGEGRVLCEGRKTARNSYACIKRQVDLAKADELLAKAKQLEARASAISALEADSLRAEAQMLRIKSVCACRPSADEGTPRCE